MKALLLALGLALSITAFAAQDDAQELSHTTLLFGYGTSYGMCDGNGMSWYCMDQLRKQAHENAVADAGRQCSIQNGTIDSFSASCNEYCTPFDIPPGSGMQNVNCTSNCSISCTLPN